jgi:hypothetical protein
VCKLQLVRHRQLYQAPQPLLPLQRYSLIFTFFPAKYPILFPFLQQQTGISASTPSMQAPQPTDVDAPQPTVAEAQTKRKALTDAEAQQKRQKSTPALYLLQHPSVSPLM